MSIITKTNKMYKLLRLVKEIQCDLVSNDGKNLTRTERELLVCIWDKIDDVSIVVSALQSMLNKEKQR